MVGVLKKAMVQALVPYNAFAREVMGLCNNRGVDFMETYADAKLQDLRLYNPDNRIESKLVPKKQHGVLYVQVTLLSL